MKYNKFLVREYEFNNPDINNLDSIFKNLYQKCKDKFFYKFNRSCEYSLQFTDIRKNKLVNKKVKIIYCRTEVLKYLVGKTVIASSKNFVFNHIDKLTIKFTALFTDIKIFHYLQQSTPCIVREFFKKRAHNEDYVVNFCNNVYNLFHRMCMRWYHYNNLATSNLMLKNKEGNYIFY